MKVNHCTKLYLKCINKKLRFIGLACIIANMLQNNVVINVQQVTVDSQCDHRITLKTITHNDNRSF